MFCGTTVNDELTKQGNIALHFCVHPSAGYALLNARTGRQWGHEDRTTRGRLPASLLQNQRFILSITVEEQQYRIDVSDITFVSFLHRHPFSLVGLLSYDGDFDVDNVVIQPPPQLPPPLHPLISPSAPHQSLVNDDNSHVLYDHKFPKLPFLLPIKNGLVTGMRIKIDAEITGNRFDVSLYQGSNPYGGDPGSDVAFHMEVYIAEKSIVRNTFQSGQWQRPEKDITYFPFLGQQYFTLVIRVEANRYQVDVNGNYVFDFYHRVHRLSSVDHLCLHGSLSISSLTILLPPL